MKLRTLAVPTLTAILLVVMIATAAVAQTGVVLYDTLQGGTSGTRNGGTFANGGWQCTDPSSGNDYIYWHLPHPVSHGRAEFYVKGINPSQPNKNEHFHMYDYTYQSADTNYWGYRQNPYKAFIRKSGVNDGAGANSCELVSQILGDGYELDSPILSWNPASNYLIALEWAPDANGNTVFNYYRDGVQFFTQSLVGTYAPTGHTVRLGACRNMGEGSQPGAVYSYLKVTDLSEQVTPPAPTIVQPCTGFTVTTRTPVLKWHGDPHTLYQVRVNTSNDPNIGVAWDSGQVSSTATQATPATLPNQTTFYPFVRIGTATGWSAWSASGYSFKVDTGYVNPRRGRVVVNGAAIQDDGGKFLALGFTHMRALHRCRGDRMRYQHDLMDMASHGFNYQRILTMVGWDHLKIAPITNDVADIWAWEDYDQQLMDTIDIAYDNYGIRTQLTIFADAQNCMPSAADRTNHMNRILSICAGREQKIMFIEVANEYYQNGLSTSEVQSDMAYLAARTTIPIAGSDPGGARSNADIQAMYQGTAADIATVHFPRDGYENGWFPVRDPWRVVSLYPGVAPVCNNEPIGPGSSVNSEDDPTRLMSAAAFGWIAHVPMYVYHGRFGTSGLTDSGVDVKMSSTGGFNSYTNLVKLMPPDVCSWTRNDGIEAAAPFSVFCKSTESGNGSENTYWTESPGATMGCHRNVGAIKGPVVPGAPFVCYTQGVLSGGVALQYRATNNYQVAFTVYNALTGAVAPVYDAATGSLLPGYDYLVMTPGAPAFKLSGTAKAYLIVGILGGHARPDQPTNFAVANSGTTNTLSWTNPSNSFFAGTIVRYKTDGYPTAPTDGNAVCNKAAAPGSNDSFAHTGVTSTGTYYYSAWSYDEVPHYCATAAHAAYGEDNKPEWIIEPFDPYTNGNLGGKGSWTTVGTASAQVESTFAKGGTGKAVIMDTVPTGQAIANQVGFREKASGYCYVSFDVSQDAVGAIGQIMGYVSIYGPTSSTEIAKVHIQKGRLFAEYAAGPASLAILTASAANLGWYNVKIGLNLDTRKLDLWLDGAAKGTNYDWKGDATSVSRIVISSDRNSSLSTQKVYIDNVRFEPRPGQVNAVTDDGAWSPSLSKMHFVFDDVPGTPGYQYALGTTSGGTQTKGWTSCGTDTDVMVTGLNLAENVNYYISVQCLNQYGMAGLSRISNGIKVPPSLAKINDAKALADGTTTPVKSLRGKLVSARYSGCFYIQEPGDPFGLKVLSSAEVDPGNQVDVCGVMKGSASERYLDATGNSVIAAGGPGGPFPAVLKSSTVGGVDLNTYTHGVTGGIGPNNIGLFVTACGTVTQRQATAPAYFYLDDGSGALDGTSTDGVPNIGIRISADPGSFPQGTYLSVTGVVSCFTSGGLRPQILPSQINTLRAP